MLLRRLLSATTVLALGLAPTAALAQDGEEPVEPVATEDATPLEQLSEALADWAEALVLGRDADGDGADDELDALAESLEVVLADVFATLHFARVEQEALEEVEDVEDVEVDQEDDGTHGEVVSTVAQCAPRGSFGALVDGMRNHGEYVTAAAHGETVDLTVPSIVEGPDGPAVGAPAEDAEPTSFDLATVEGATALCDALDVVYEARLLQLEVAWEDVDGARDARVLAREQCRIERLRADDAEAAKDVCAELRERVRDQHAADREARAAEREQAKADRAAKREQAKADRAAEREQAKADRAAQREERAAARDEATSERAGGKGRPDRG